MPLTFQEAAQFIQSKGVMLPAEYYGLEQSKARNLAFSIAGVSSRNQLQGVLDSLKESLSSGLTFAEWKDKVRSGSISLDLPEYRLNNIYRTNVQSAYGRGNWQQQERMQSIRPYLMYDAINDTRVRPSHVELDGVIKPVDDPFWSTHYPPNGYQCRCSAVSLTEKQAKARGGVTAEPQGGWPKTDKGWDFNPGRDYEKGVSESAQPVKEGSDMLQREMSKVLSKGDATRQDLTAALKGESPEKLIKVLENIKAENLKSMTPALSESALRMSALTSEHQVYLRLALEKTVKSGSAQASLGLSGEAGAAAVRMADEILAAVELPAKTTVYYVPKKAGAYTKGQRVKTDGFWRATQEMPEAAKQVLVIESSSSLPIAFISENAPLEIEYLIVPGSDLKVTKIDGNRIFLREA